MYAYDRAKSAEQIASFRDDLGETSYLDFKPLPDLTRYIDHHGFESEYPTPKPGFYLCEKVLGALARSCVDTIEIQPDDSLKLGREDSRHQIFLGPITFMESGRPVYEASVAVKARRAELNELAMHQQMEKLGIRTYKPFGLVVGATGNRHLMTFVDRTAKSIDGIDWNLLSEADMWHGLEAGPAAMVATHEELLFLTDRYFKNIVVDDIGLPVGADPEGMLSFRALGDFIQSTDNTVDAESRARRSRCLSAIAEVMGREFLDVAESVEQSILPILPKAVRPKNEQQEFAVLSKGVYEPYGRLMRQSKGKYAKVALEAFKLVYKKHRRDARNGMLHF